MHLDVPHSEYDEAYLLFTPLDEGLHPFSSSPFLATIRDLSRDPHLLLVGREGDNHVSLASWIFRPHEAQVPVVQKLLVIRDSHSLWPDDLPLPHELRVRLLPHAQFQEVRRNTRRAEDSLKRSQKADTFEARSSAVNRLRRMGLTREASDLSCGATPFALPSPSSRDNWFSLIKDRSAS